MSGVKNKIQPPAKPVARKTDSVPIWILSIGFAAIALFVVFQCVAGHFETDLFWHLRAGREIVATGVIPHHDTFSWTCLGVRWDAVEWLSFVMFYLSYSAAGGFSGPVVAAAAVLVLAVWALWTSLLRLRYSLGDSILLVTLVTLVITPFLQPRPQIFTYLFLPIVTFSLVQAERRARTSSWIWGLIPMFALWANLHPGVVVGLSEIIAFAFGSIVESLLCRQGDVHAALRSKARTFTILGAACGLASLLTPFGLGLYRLVLVTVGSGAAMSGVAEWRHFEFEPNNMGDWYLLALLVMVAVRIARNRKRVSWNALGYLILLGLEGALHNRNMPLLALCSPILAAGRRPDGEEDEPESAIAASRWLGTPRSFLCYWSVIVLAAAAFCAHRIAYYPARFSPSLMEQSSDMAVGLDLFPEEASSFLNYMHFPADMRFYNDYDIGGFMIFNNPDHPVFMDGRNDVYRGPLLDNCVALMTENWQNLPSLKPEQDIFLDKFDFDAVYTNNRLVAQHFHRRPDWILVYTFENARLRDSRMKVNAWIFVRDRPAFRALIERSRTEWASHHQGQPPMILD